MFVFSLLSVYSVNTSGSPNIGLIFGIAVGCVAVVLLIVATVLIIVCYDWHYIYLQTVRLRTVYPYIRSYLQV